MRPADWRSGVLVVWWGLMAVGCPGGGGSSDAGPGDAGDAVGGDEPGPEQLVDLERARGRPGLEMEVSRENSGKTPVITGGFRGEVYEVDFNYRSQTVLGNDWRHQAVMMMPQQRAEGVPEGAFAVVQAQTPNPVSEVSGPGSYQKNYAGLVAAALGVPTMVVSRLPGELDLSSAPDGWSDSGPSRCFGSAIPAERYTPCMLSILRRTDDLRADPFRYLMRGWIRAVTAAESIEAEVELVEWENEPPIQNFSRAILLGDGARGVAARMAAAVDPRIDGAYVNADFARVEEMLAEMQDRWSSDFGWFRDPEAFAGWLETEKGQEWLATVDPARWSEMLEGGVYVDARGLADSRFPLGGGARIRAVSPEESRSVTVPEYGAGIGSSTHLASWLGFVARVYRDASWVAPETTIERDGGNVDVTLEASGEGTVAGATALWVKQHSNADDRDFRDTTWSTTQLQSSDGAWSGRFAPIADNVAIVAQARTEVEISPPGGDGSMTLTPAWSTPVETLE